MALRLTPLANGDAFLDDGAHAVRLSDITKLSDFPDTTATTGMVKYELRTGACFGHINASLAEVLVLLAGADDGPVPLTEAELRAQKKAHAERLESIMYRSAT